MARFERPKGTVESINDIKLGDRLWHVLGILPPSTSSAVHVVTRAPAPFKEHPEYSGIHAGQANEIVFDTKWGDYEFSSMQFAASGNLLPGPSYNDNYWCRTREEAEAARDFIRAQWDARPDLIHAELLRREEDAAFEAEMDRYYDDYPDEDAA